MSPRYSHVYLLQMSTNSYVESLGLDPRSSMIESSARGHRLACLMDAFANQEIAWQTDLAERLDRA